MSREEEDYPAEDLPRIVALKAGVRLDPPAILLLYADTKYNKKRIHTISVNVRPSIAFHRLCSCLCPICSSPSTLNLVCHLNLPARPQENDLQVMDSASLAHGISVEYAPYFSPSIVPFEKLVQLMDVFIEEYRAASAAYETSAGGAGAGVDGGADGAPSGQRGAGAGGVDDDEDADLQGEESLASSNIAFKDSSFEASMTQGGGSGSGNGGAGGRGGAPAPSFVPALNFQSLVDPLPAVKSGVGAGVGAAGAPAPKAPTVSYVPSSPTNSSGSADGAKAPSQPGRSAASALPPLRGAAPSALPALATAPAAALAPVPADKSASQSYEADDFEIEDDVDIDMSGGDYDDAAGAAYGLAAPKPPAAAAVPPAAAAARAAGPAENLNKVSAERLAAAKAEMDEDFSKHQVRRGDPGYEHDVRKDFAIDANATNEWDED